MNPFADARAHSDADLNAMARRSTLLDEAAATLYALGETRVGALLLQRSDALMDHVSGEYDRRHPETVAP